MNILQTPKSSSQQSQLKTETFTILPSCTWSHVWSTPQYTILQSTPPQFAIITITTKGCQRYFAKIFTIFRRRPVITLWTTPYSKCFHTLGVTAPWSTDLDGVIPNVVFTHQPHFSCSYLPLICLSTNQIIQLIHYLLIRIE